MRPVACLVALVAVASLLVACSSEAALPGQVVATIGPGAGLATTAPATSTTASANGGPGASQALPGTTGLSPMPTEAPTPAPPAATPAPATPANGVITGTVNVTGTAPSDIPGLLIGPGAKVTSVVDANLKPRDVYSIDLVAGNTYLVTRDNGGTEIWLANPGSKSFKRSDTWQGSHVCAFVNTDCWDITPAVSGRYFLAVDPIGTLPEQYTFTIETK